MRVGYGGHKGQMQDLIELVGWSLQDVQYEEGGEGNCKNLLDGYKSVEGSCDQYKCALRMYILGSNLLMAENNEELDSNAAVSNAGLVCVELEQISPVELPFCDCAISEVKVPELHDICTKPVEVYACVTA